MGQLTDLKIRMDDTVSQYDLTTHPADHASGKTSTTVMVSQHRGHVPNRNRS